MSVQFYVDGHALAQRDPTGPEQDAYAVDKVVPNVPRKTITLVTALGMAEPLPVILHTPDNVVKKREAVQNFLADAASPSGGSKSSTTP